MTPASTAFSPEPIKDKLEIDWKARTVWLTLKSEGGHRRRIGWFDDNYLHILRDANLVMHTKQAYGVCCEMVDQLFNLSFLIVHDHRGVWRMPMDEVQRCETDRYKYTSDGIAYEAQYFVKLNDLKEFPH
jgi:hypothetical protein